MRTAPLLLPILSGLIFAAVPGMISAQTPQSSPAAPRVEPGLERAVQWKWTAVPSLPGTWGLKIPDPPSPETPQAAATPKIPADNQSTYTVKSGDALVKIARRHNITVEQLKAFNKLTTDLIRVGDTLQIPTAEQLAMLPQSAGVPAAKPKRTAANDPVLDNVDPETLMLQIYLDRKNFSPGVIDGVSGPSFQKLMFRYLSLNPQDQDPAALRSNALAEVGEMFTSYQLRHEDFRFIAPPRATAATPTPTPTPSGGGKKPAASRLPKLAPLPKLPPPTYELLLETPFLAYRTPWEFVAERYHCSESLLRALNPTLPFQPTAGTVFRVPNTRPFEIESAFRQPAQPEEGSLPGVKATIYDLQRMEISRDGQILASLPLRSARPGLRGRGEWKTMSAIPRPRLSTVQEPREQRQRPVNSFYQGTAPAPEPTPALLSEPQFLAPGPNNPVGILWIDLARASETTPLPFGLHGTSTPGTDTPSIGGFRMTNWDILRAARLLPPGTLIEWTETPMPTAAPAAVVPAASSEAVVPAASSEAVVPAASSEAVVPAASSEAVVPATEPVTPSPNPDTPAQP